ncbi:MAG: outer membrane beta-barrel family protein [Muribaculaceae bacterium]|nr:outer membrane beta-barrel family protein [Muribaculaceae bacterium]
MQNCSYHIPTIFLCGRRFLACIVLAIGSVSVCSADTDGRLQTDVKTAENDTAATELPEVEIKADREIYKKDHVVLTLSEANRRFGSNALEAISTLSRFITVLNSDRLTSYQGRNVYVLIDGVPSTPEMLRTYQAGDIRDVEYYDVPPARYRVYTEGPLVNVRLRRRHDMMVSAYVSAQSAVADVNTSDMAVLTYADSLNQVKASYTLNHSNAGDLIRDIEYLYPDGGMTIEHIEARNKYLMQNLNLSYQSTRGHHLFNAKARYDWQHRLYRTPGSAEIFEDGISVEGFTDRHTRTSRKILSADLYYCYRHSERRSVQVNIGNAFGKGDHRQHLMRDIPTPWEALNYDIYNNTDNSTYNFSGDISGQCPLGSVDLSGVFRYTRRSLSQKATSGTYRSSEDEEFLSAGATWSRGIMTLSGSAGMTVITENTSAGKTTSVSPYGYLGFWLRGRDRWRGASASLTMFTRQGSFPASNTTANYTYIDRRYISVGNPSLKPSTAFGPEMRLQYFDPQGKWFVSLYGQMLRIRDAQVPLVYMENDIAVRQVANLPHTLGFFGQLTGRWVPLKWFFIQPVLTFGDTRYSTPSGRVHGSNLQYGCNATVMAGDLSAALGAFSPKKTWEGNTCSREAAFFFVSLTYRLRAFTFGLTYNRYCRGSRYTEGGDGFSYILRSYDRPYRNWVRLSATWFFSKGRQFYHPQKSLGDVQGDVALPNNR